MKNCFLLSLLNIIILMFYSTSDAQNQFHFILGRQHNETAHSIIQVDNNKYIACGHSLALGVSDVYIVQFSTAGVIQWSKAINGPWTGLYNYKIIKTSDGGYIISGQSSLSGVTSFDVYIIKLNVNGDVQWVKQIGSSETDYGRSIVQASDGGYLIAGYTNLNGVTNNDFLIVKLSANGDYLWSKTIGGAGNDFAQSILRSQDGNFVIAGTSNSFGAGGTDFFVVKIDVSGTILWSKAVGGIGNESANSIIQSSDGGYAITGSSSSFGSGNSDVYVVKLDGSGNLQWTKTIGGTGDDFASSITQTSDNNYIISGQTNSFSSSFDMYLIKLNAEGLLLLSKTFGGTGNESANSIIQSLDGGYVTAGYTNSFGAVGSDFLITKFDFNLNTCANTIIPLSTSGTGGTISTISPTVNSPTLIVTSPVPNVLTDGTLTTLCTTVGIYRYENTIPDKFQLYQNFPNPFNPVTKIKFQVPVFSHITFKIYNSLGEEIETLVNENLHPAIYEVEWNAFNYPSGIYFYTIKSSLFAETKKMILIK